MTAQAVNGVATFNNLTLSALGDYTLQATDGSYTAATSAGFAVVSPGVATPVYRLFSPITAEHLYTTDVNEWNVLATEGWIQEGVFFEEYNGPAVVGGVSDIPLYRLYDTTNRQHLWTTDLNEFTTLSQVPGWNSEGIAAYVFPSAIAGSTPLYRMSYPFLPDMHLWTTDLNEYDTLYLDYGWVKEGVIGYVIAE